RPRRLGSAAHRARPDPDPRADRSRGPAGGPRGSIPGRLVPHAAPGRAVRGGRRAERGSRVPARPGRPAAGGVGVRRPAPVSLGAAFPSSHVAAAVVAAVCALRYWRRLGLVLTPFTLGLVLSVVYGQFHYAVDAVAGLIVAGAVLVSHTIYYATAPAAAPAALPERGL